MIEIQGLSKRYGNHVAVDNISFTVNKGEILGFLGPNGAGKSTTMNIITGYISSTEGTVKIDGYDILEQPAEAKKRIGYLPEHPPLYMDMTVREYLNFVYEIKKAEQNRKAHLDEIMDLVKIGDVQNRLIKNLSKGYQQRVGLAQALVGSPEVLILDEPTVGLDPKQIIEIRNVITDLGKDHTIILSSHILPEVSAICERVIIINKGRIVAIDTPENLSKVLMNESRLLVRIAGPENQVLNILKEIDGIKYVDSQGEKERDTIDYIIEAESNVDIRKPLFYALSNHQYPIMMMKSMNLSLEEIFLQLTTDRPSSVEIYPQNGQTETTDAVPKAADEAPEIPETAESTEVAEEALLENETTDNVSEEEQEGQEE